MSSSPLEDATPGARIRILIARLLGVGFIAYLLVSVPGVVEGARILAGWWTPIALVLVFGPGLSLLVATFVAPNRIPVCAALAAVGILLATILWLPAWDGAVIDDAVRGTWLSAFAGLAGLCAALVWRPPITLTIQFCASWAAALIDQLGLFGAAASPSDVVYAGTWAFGFAALLCAAVIMALRTGAVLDATRDSLERTAAEAAAAQARGHERSRFDALIHDRVLTTLLATSRPDTDRRLADDARAALLELDFAAMDSGRGERISATLFAQQLTAVVVDTADDAAVTIGMDDRAATYPAVVTAALGGATAEALRNSIQHAGPGAQRCVVVELRWSVARVVVSDTGIGFDTRAVAPERLGIDVSIVARMAKLGGGRSEVVSDPGTGTTVVLEWAEGS